MPIIMKMMMMMMMMIMMIICNSVKMRLDERVMPSNSAKERKRVVMIVVTRVFRNRFRIEPEHGGSAISRGIEPEPVVHLVTFIRTQTRNRT